MKIKNNSQIYGVLGFLTLLIGCATTPPVTANYYVEVDSGDIFFTIKHPITIEIPLPKKQWIVQKINSYQFRFIIKKADQLDKFIEISVFSLEKLKSMVKSEIVNPTKQFMDWEIRYQMNSGIGFKENKRDVETGYFELENDMQITSSICWVEGDYLVVMNYIFTDKTEFSDVKIKKIVNNIEKIDAQEFEEKMKNYNVIKG